MPGNFICKIDGENGVNSNTLMFIQSIHESSCYNVLLGKFCQEDPF